MMNMWNIVDIFSIECLPTKISDFVTKTSRPMENNECTISEVYHSIENHLIKYQNRSVDQNEN